MSPRFTALRLAVYSEREQARLRAQCTVYDPVWLPLSLLLYVFAGLRCLVPLISSACLLCLFLTLVFLVCCVCCVCCFFLIKKYIFSVVCIPTCNACVCCDVHPGPTPRGAFLPVRQLEAATERKTGRLSPPPPPHPPTQSTQVHREPLLHPKPRELGIVRCIPVYHSTKDLVPKTRADLYSVWMV